MKYWALTEEQKEARRERSKEWKRNNKERRTAEGYAKPKRGYNHMKKTQMAQDAWWERLKQKHAKWESTRLKKSLKPPVFLELDKGYGR
jgi:hypothetical protein